jgi:hypothetical protein
MALNISVTRGYTVVVSVPVSVEDWNALGLPSIAMTGSVGSSDIEDGAVNSTHVVPGPNYFALTTGSANAYVAAPDPALTALTTGAWVCCKLNFTNTGAATLAVNGLAATAIKKQVDQALVAGDLRSGAVHWFQYDGTYWQLTTPANSPRKVYASATGGTNAYAVTLPDWAVNALSDLGGVIITFTANADNTGPATLSVNGLTATAITKLDSTPLAAGDLPGGAIIAVVYDGSTFQLLGNYGAAALADTAVTPGTYTNPVTLVVDAKGRITSVAEGSASAFTTYESNTVAVPAAAGTVTASPAHGFGAKPFSHWWQLENVTASAGHTTGDGIPLGLVMTDNGGGALWNAFSDVSEPGTPFALKLRRTNQSAIWVVHKTTGVLTDITADVAGGNWVLRCYAIK